jgi:murein DD-endopeptidase MepM/ murein hydrolase activator NlpD
VRLAYRGPLPARFHYCPQWSLFGPVRPNGKWHRGVDIAAATGTPVRGAVNGMLKYSRDPNGWGLFARLRFNVAKRAADGSCAPGEDHEILYAHLIDDKPDLVMGVEHEVAAGVIVGRVGCSGNARRMCSPSPESHVHVTLRTVRDRMQIDPLPLAGWTLQTGGADGLAPCLWPTQPPAPAAEAGQT